MGARAGCAEPGAGRRRPRMCGIGAAEAVLHIRPGPASDGSAESCGNVLAFNTGEILPCAEGVALYMGARPLRIDILVGVPESCGKPRAGPRESRSRMCSTAAWTGKSWSLADLRARVVKRHRTGREEPLDGDPAPVR